MRRQWSLVSIVILSTPFLAIGLSCGQSKDIVNTVETIPTGTMAYTGYDESGNVVVEGWVDFDGGILTETPTAPVNVTGRWHLRRVRDDYEIGPQVGDGDLAGVLDNGHLSVNFNPLQKDGNVVAEGAYTIITGPTRGASWEGTWTAVAFAGPRRTGAFRASSVANSTTAR